MTAQEIVNRNVEFRYQLLDRMREDCIAYLGVGGRSPFGLWAKNTIDHITIMYAIWDSFTAEQKPKWLTRRNIDDYRERMIYTPPA